MVQKKVLKWMRNNVLECVENGEVNCTKLAENACAHFDIRLLDNDPDHWVWDMSFDVRVEWDIKAG